MSIGTGEQLSVAFEEVHKCKTVYSDKLKTNRKTQLSVIKRLKTLREEEEDIRTVKDKIDDCIASYPANTRQKTGSDNGGSILSQ